ncbi:MAG: hypothetical protein BEN18_07250 [Epulopiscium sp. Nuni2H_MBin001]|nr:MAG: hypothetical protein BEN18_07250 [Epulopiscium sp. Nuni2H_MBin001]
MDKAIIVVQLVCLMVLYPLLMDRKDELDNLIVNKNIELERLTKIASNDINYLVEQQNNLLPKDEGITKQTDNLLNPLITSINPITTNYLDIGVIEREYEVSFTGPILKAIESIQNVYPLTKVGYIDWRTDGKMRILVYTDDK